MDKDRNYKTSNLSYVLQIGQTQEMEDAAAAAAFSEGRFDEQMNFVIGDGPHPSVFWPCEWTVIPEIVELAKQRGVEIPENPEFDLSRTF